MPESQCVELASHILDIRHRRRPRVRARLDRVLLSRQTEGIVAERVQNILAQHSVVARKDIRGDVAQWVSHVQTCPGGVGEHVLDVELVRWQLLRT